MVTIRAPWRRVLSRSGPQRAYTRDLDGRPHWYVYRVERLECEHRLQVPRGYPKANKRRCRQCQQQEV